MISQKKEKQQSQIKSANTIGANHFAVITKFDIIEMVRDFKKKSYLQG